ncbi:hypothetical protein [Pseudorhizobium banfieldiae]|nr:hypothetical protein [Pseudorhizobium banfieldiae]
MLEEFMSIYYRYSDDAAPGALVVRLYRSADEVRAFIREKASDGAGDSIFPGEEMEPEAAFRMAENKNRDNDHPIYVELMEGISWNPSWGELQ